MSPKLSRGNQKGTHPFPTLHILWCELNAVEEQTKVMRFNTGIQGFSMYQGAAPAPKGSRLTHPAPTKRRPEFNLYSSIQRLRADLGFHSKTSTRWSEIWTSQHQRSKGAKGTNDWFNLPLSQTQSWQSSSYLGGPKMHRNSHTPGLSLKHEVLSALVVTVRSNPGRPNPKIWGSQGFQFHWSPRRSQTLPALIRPVIVFKLTPEGWYTLCSWFLMSFNFCSRAVWPSALSALTSNHTQQFGWARETPLSRLLRRFEAKGGVQRETGWIWASDSIWSPHLFNPRIRVGNKIGMKFQRHLSFIRQLGRDPLAINSKSHFWVH